MNRVKLRAVWLRGEKGVKKHKMSTPCGRTEIFDFEEGALFPPTYVGEGWGEGEILLIVIPNCGFWQE